jgi:hypothetical protein
MKRHQSQHNYALSPQHRGHPSPCWPLQAPVQVLRHPLGDLKRCSSGGALWRVGRDAGSIERTELDTARVLFHSDGIMAVAMWQAIN